MRCGCHYYSVFSVLVFTQMIEETNRNVQLTMATQSLQSRLTAMERSANALRELLRQKFGDTGVVHMMEALENLGAGSNALLEVPASSSASVTTAQMGHLPAHQYGGNSGGSGESKASYAETHSPQANRTSLLQLQGKPAGSGALSMAGPSSNNNNKEKFAMPNSGSNNKYGGGSSAGVDEEDPSQMYSKAIEKALYR